MAPLTTFLCGSNGVCFINSQFILGFVHRSTSKSYGKSSRLEVSGILTVQKSMDNSTAILYSAISSPAFILM